VASLLPLAAVRACSRTVSAWPEIRPKAASVAVPANLPFASIDQFRLAQFPLGVPVRPRGWLGQARRLAVGHSRSPDPLGSHPGTWRR